MNNRQLELALLKQRLQYRSAEQRQELARGLKPLVPALVIAEAVRSGARWVREHPAISTGLLVAIAVAKPRVAARWARRGWLAWQAWRKLRLMGSQASSRQAS